MSSFRSRLGPWALALVATAAMPFGDLACNDLIGVHELTQRDPVDAGDAGDAADAADVLVPDTASPCDTAGLLEDPDNCGVCAHKCLESCRVGVCLARRLVDDAGGIEAFAVDPSPDGCVYFGHYPGGRSTIECVKKDGFLRRTIYTEPDLAFELKDFVFTPDWLYGIELDAKVDAGTPRTTVFRADPMGAIGGTTRIVIDGVGVTLAVDPAGDLYVALRGIDPSIVRLPADLSSSTPTFVAALPTTRRGLQVDPATHLLYVAGTSGIHAVDPTTSTVDTLLPSGPFSFTMDADNVYAFVGVDLYQVAKHSGCGGTPHCVTKLSSGYGSDRSLIADDRWFYWAEGYGALNRLARKAALDERPTVIGNDTKQRLWLEQDATSLYYVLDVDGALMRLGK